MVVPKRHDHIVDDHPSRGSTFWASPLSSFRKASTVSSTISSKPQKMHGKFFFRLIESVTFELTSCIASSRCWCVIADAFKIRNSLH